MTLRIGNEVETTDEFKRLAGEHNHVEGTIKSIGVEYADVETNDGKITSVGLQWLQILQFEVGDKVETTLAHDKFFGTYDKGIVDEVDGDYIGLYTQGGFVITIHKKWLHKFEGDLLFFYRGVLV